MNPTFHCVCPSIVVSRRDAPGATVRTRRCTKCGELFRTLDLSDEEFAALTAPVKDEPELEPRATRADVREAHRRFRERSEDARAGRDRMGR